MESDQDWFSFATMRAMALLLVLVLCAGPGAYGFQTETPPCAAKPAEEPTQPEPESAPPAVSAPTEPCPEQPSEDKSKAEKQKKPGVPKWQYVVTALVCPPCVFYLWQESKKQ